MKVVDDGGGERTSSRFPCIATVRYTVAAVLTALAIAVVVMVIADFLRPESFDLRVLHGHVAAELRVMEMDSSNNNSLACRPCSHGKRPPGSFGRVLRPEEGCRLVKFVDLWVMLSASNPGDRGDINIYNMTVRVIDGTPYAHSFVSNNLIASYNVTTEAYSLKPGSTHTRTKWGAVRDGGSLCKIAARHRNQTSFRAMLRVDATVSSVTALRKTRPRLVTYYCWPVSVTVDYSPDDDDGPVLCKTGEDVY
ncbi:hypothetical protein ACP4OV_017328 [Aristida adscensionis]